MTKIWNYFTQRTLLLWTVIGLVLTLCGFIGLGQLFLVLLIVALFHIEEHLRVLRQAVVSKTEKKDSLLLG